MSENRDIVLASSQAKDAALFFDHVIPILGHYDILIERLNEVDYIPFDDLIISMCPQQIDSNKLLKDIHRIQKLLEKPLPSHKCNQFYYLKKQYNDFIKKHIGVLKPESAYLK